MLGGEVRSTAESTENCDSGTRSVLIQHVVLNALTYYFP